MAPATPAITYVSLQNLGNPANVLHESPVELSRMLFMLYQDIEQQINRADLKAQITLSTATIFAALAVNLGLGIAIPAFDKMSGLERAAFALYGLCAVGLCVAIGCAVAAAYPRALRPRQAAPAERNLYFSADLIQLSPDEYVEHFCKQTNGELRAHVLKQIHVKSQVLEAKLLFVRRGMRALVAAILTWGIAHGALLLAYGQLMKG